MINGQDLRTGTAVCGTGDYELNTEGRLVVELNEITI